MLKVMGEWVLGEPRLVCYSPIESFYHIFKFLSYQATLGPNQLDRAAQSSPISRTSGLQTTTTDQEMHARTLDMPSVQPLSLRL